MHRAELLRIKWEEGLQDDEFYHYDTPLTVEHEIEALEKGGFSHVEILNNWAQPCTLKAIK